MLSAVNNPFILSAFMPIVIILYVFAPLSSFKAGHIKVEHLGKLLPRKTLCSA